MYGAIKSAIQAYSDSAPKECLSGIKISIVSVVLILVGRVVVSDANPIAGTILVAVGIGCGLCGLLMYGVGQYKKSSK